MHSSNLVSKQSLVATQLVAKQGARRALGAVATLAALLGAAGAVAAEPPSRKDLTLGKWELDLAKSKFCTAAPRKSTRNIIDAGWGLMSAHATGVNSKGEPMEFRYVWRYDGGKYPADITKPDADESISWKLVSPSRVEFVHWSKDGKITQELVRTVSADGQTMTQTTKFIGGKECVDTQVFQRR